MNAYNTVLRSAIRWFEVCEIDPCSGTARRLNDAHSDEWQYVPYVVERWTAVQGSQLDLYYVLSTWNPYVVVLMKSRLRVE
jgi:hypothetical protein